MDMIHQVLSAIVNVNMINLSLGLDPHQHFVLFGNDRSLHKISWKPVEQCFHNPAYKQTVTQTHTDENTISYMYKKRIVSVQIDVGHCCTSGLRVAWTKWIMSLK